MRYHKKLKFKDDERIYASEVIDFLLFFTLYSFLLHDISNQIATCVLIFWFSYFSATSLNCEKKGNK